MITITPTGFTVEVKTEFPAEACAETVADLIDVLCSIDPEMRGNNNYLYLHKLLESMYPTAAQATAMFSLEDKQQGFTLEHKGNKPCACSVQKPSHS